MLFTSCRQHRFSGYGESKHHIFIERVFVPLFPDLLPVGKVIFMRGKVLFFISRHSNQVKKDGLYPNRKKPTRFFNINIKLGPKDCGSGEPHGKQKKNHG